MRDILFDELFEYMENNDNSFLLTSDTGFGLLDKFFINSMEE